MCGTAFRTDESSLMIDHDTFLMGVDGMCDTFRSVFFYVGVVGPALTAAASVLDSDFLVDDIFMDEFMT